MFSAVHILQRLQLQTSCFLQYTSYKGCNCYHHVFCSTHLTKSANANIMFSAVHILQRLQLLTSCFLQYTSLTWNPMICIIYTTIFNLSATIINTTTTTTTTIFLHSFLPICALFLCLVFPLTFYRPYQFSQFSQLHNLHKVSYFPISYLQLHVQSLRVQKIFSPFCIISLSPSPLHY